KKIKLFLYLICTLFLLLVFATLLLPSKGQAVGSATIYASREVVWEQLTNLKTYPKWFPWIDEDSTDILYYGTKTKLKGFSFMRKQKKNRFGRYELGEREGDSLLEYKIKIKDVPEFYGDFILKRGGEGNAVVVWKLHMDAGWKHWWRFYAAIMNKTTKPILDTGLARLKKVCERL